MGAEGPAPGRDVCAASSPASVSCLRENVRPVAQPCVRSSLPNLHVHPSPRTTCLQIGSWANISWGPLSDPLTVASLLCPQII